MKKGTLKSVAALAAVVAVGVVPVCANVIANGVSLSTSTSSSASVSYKLGDVNRDGKVALDDTLLILGVAVGIDKDEYKFDAEQVSLADYDNDGVVTLNDTLLSLQEAIGVVK